MPIKQSITCLLALALFALPSEASARKGPTVGNRTSTPSGQQRIEFRNNCDNATAQRDMEVNNVRARLTTGGDVWWDGTNGRYVVPKPPDDQEEVSSLFAGAVWLGGLDPGGGLKISAQQYGRSQGEFDYYTGPLTSEGTTSRDTCSNWDMFFNVTGQEIRDHRRAFDSIPTGTSLDPQDISDNVLGWPGDQNPYFFQVHGFELPGPEQGSLAGFFDRSLDGIYDPTDGDYPIIEIRDCPTDSPQFPEEMSFWIYNDAGNVHRQSNTTNQIRMEVQVQAFAYTTSDDINNMTFQRYKLINRAPEDIIDTYFAMWVDPDLGCFQDDFVGTDTTRSLAYVYNQDARDGVGTTCECDQGIPTYCDEIPILGVDYFRGPRAPLFRADTFVREIELGMSSFIYLNNCGVGDPEDATCDPQTAPEYYNYLQGRWRDGTPLCQSGDGYQESPCAETRYIFPDAPNDASGFSMTTANLPFGDRRTLQASGPFTLTPGAVNELIIGVVWVGNQSYPNPSIRRLQQADDLAQSLFDNCFDICDGPDAPDVDILELDQEIILLLSNDPGSNNANEGYSEPGLGIPDSVTVDNVRVLADSLYRFEGYRVFQFANSSVSLADVENPDLVREVAQFDVENNVTRVFDWNAIDGDDNPLPGNFFVPELQVDGQNAGINRSIRITSDAFGVGDQTQLVNHRQYYFTVIAYGYNNYKEYNPLNTVEPGQRQQYKPSSRNIGDSRTGNAFYTVIPRPILDQNLMAEYGDPVQIRRLAGEGNGGEFLDIDTVTRQDMEEVMRDESAYEEEDYGFDGEITYQTGAGPIEVFVSNPFNIRDGEYEIRIIDELADGDELADNARWTLRCLDDCGVETIMSERPISELNEQLVSEFGFSVVIRDVPEPGTSAARRQNNGAIGQRLEYADPDGDRWLSFVTDGTPAPFLGTAVGAEVFNYVNTGETEEFQVEDSMQAYATLFNGVYPLALMDWTSRANVPFFFSPVWLEGDAMARVASGLDLEDLNNIDIVFTSDKSLWSRCPIVETATPFFDDVVIDGEEIAEGNPIQFDTRAARSVTREAGPDGLPTIDEDIGSALMNGMGWFPGYAIDVETGQRLEIFFGENSLYDGRLFDEDNPDLGATPGNGADMMFNPSSSFVIPPLGDFESLPFSYVSGGHHYFYVTTEPYDRGVNLERRLEPRGGQFTRKVQVLRNITWAGFPLLTPGTELLSYEDGLIPNDVRLKLRVNNDFDYAEGVPEVSDDYPTYQFTIQSNAPTELNAAEVDNSLDQIQIVPNPYYGFSAYENGALDNRVKITNLPNAATVTIYSLDGKFIRQYDRDVTPTELRGASRPFGRRQTVPSLDWDLRNFKGIPVASGVYLVHVAVPGLGERTLKWFGVQREFDPSGL